MRFGRLALVLPLSAVPWAAGRAQQPVDHLYHVRYDTYGCVNPRAALAITNEQDPRHDDPGWVEFVVNDGHCTPITPQSPWRMVSHQGELALMSYAGTTGPPGSFYMRFDQLAELAPSIPFAAPANPGGNPPAAHRFAAARPNPPLSHLLASLRTTATSAAPMDEGLTGPAGYASAALIVAACLARWNRRMVARRRGRRALQRWTGEFS